MIVKKGYLLDSQRGFDLNLLLHLRSINGNSWSPHFGFYFKGLDWD